jgi:1,2-diacylglycerol 3-beta-galactosyltransferase
LERVTLNIPFVTVVTDMIESWDVWYRPSTTLCLVPTTSIGRQAMRLGIPETKISVVGQPVSLKMKAEPGGKSAVRRQLGLESDRPVVLLAGGGEGYGRIYDIAQAIDQQVPGIQLVVIAGRNRALRTKLEARRWHLPTLTYGFTSRMAELMQAADLFITKAGPGGISEAFVVGLPLILFDYIPGQEDANVQYVLHHDAGVYIPDPQQIVDQLTRWLGCDKASLARLARNGASLARPDAALSTARHVYELIT